MPGPLDPFTPGPDATPFAGVEPSTFDKVRNEWAAFLDDPKGRAAVMSMGLALTQPPSFGDNAISQIGRAIGAGGTSAQLMEQQDLKRSELESKDAMRESQAQARLMTADAAQQRADAAGARLGTAGAQLELRRQALENAQGRSQMNARLRLSNMYQNYIKDVTKRNDPIQISMRPGATPEPVLSFPDWVKNNPSLRTLGLLDETGQGGGGTEDLAPIPAAADTTSLPQVPANKADLKPNVTYQTPRGPLKWTGTGFVQP